MSLRAPVSASSDHMTANVDCQLDTPGKGTSLEESLPLDWPVSIFVEHLLESLLIKQGPAHCGRHHP